MPTHPRVHIGVWEDDSFRGVVIFSRGASRNLAANFGLEQTEVAELTRIALREHRAPVTRIVKIAVKLLRDLSPGLRLLVSYADPKEGHIGAIYQAGNWLYLGETGADREYIGPDGKRVHSRMVTKAGWTFVYGKYRRVLTPDQCTRVELPPKHKYAFPLDAEIRSQLMQISKPYPKKSQPAAVV